MPSACSGRASTQLDCPRRQALLVISLLLGACSPTTPLFIAQVTANEVVEYKAMKSKRMTAAVEEEGNLPTYSAIANRDAISAEAEAEELYLLALSETHVQPDIPEKALYQLGLMYPAPDNPHADRDKAIAYLRRLLVQFPSGDRTASPPAIWIRRSTRTELEGPVCGA